MLGTFGTHLLKEKGKVVWCGDELTNLTDRELLQLLKGKEL